MIYLSGVTNDADEPTLIQSGVGLMIQPGNSYHLRIGRYPYWAADNGCFNPDTYLGDDRLLEWLDRLDRERCLFAVVPDVSRRPDGSLGGDPVATWHRFEELGGLYQEMGFPAALAAQDGIEDMGNLRDQIDACDVLFLAGSTEWKTGDAAASVARLARDRGKWVHMGRVNSIKRLRQAAEMGCSSADGTYLKYRRRKSGHGAVRGAMEFAGWYEILDSQPSMFTFETHALDVHRRALDARNAITARSVGAAPPPM